MSKATWKHRWSQLAKTVASWSRDESTKVGAVIVDERNVVLSLGWNDIPRRVFEAKEKVPERHVRPEKYFWYEHAERNAIYNAAANGTKLLGSTLFVTMHPCADCARGIIQSGIKKVIITDPYRTEGWEESIKRSLEMFREAEVQVEIFAVYKDETHKDTRKRDEDNKN